MVHCPPNWLRHRIVSVCRELEVAYSVANLLLSHVVNVRLHYLLELLGVLDEPDDGQGRLRLVAPAVGHKPANNILDERISFPRALGQASGCMRHIPVYDPERQMAIDDSHLGTSNRLVINYTS